MDLKNLVKSAVKETLNPASSELQELDIHLPAPITAYAGFTERKRTTMPEDGWSISEYRDLISRRWYQKTGKLHVGSQKYDTQQLSKIVNTCRHSLGLPNYCVVDMIESFFERMGDNEYDAFPYWFILKNFMPNYYNQIKPDFDKWNSIDSDLGVVPRTHLVLDSGPELRHSIGKYVTASFSDEGIMTIDSIDPRLVMQLGVEVMYVWLKKQTSMSQNQCIILILKALTSLKESDTQSRMGLSGYTDRLETALKNTMAFEPYPWTELPEQVDIRRGLLDKMEWMSSAYWWRPQRLKGGTAVPASLKSVKTKSRELPNLIKYSNFSI